MALDDLLAESIAIWDACPGTFFPPGREHTPAEQAANETQLAESRQSLRAQLTNPDREQAHALIARAFVKFARSGLDLEDRHAELLLTSGFATVGPALEKQARLFDPSVGDADILQACRNAWAACGLQCLFERPMGLTPSIFGYSMLYPYTDNYLDDPAVSSADKLRFSERFRARLAGERLAPTNASEEAIWHLVSLIESEYARAEFPGVYESLMDIHHAQEQSLRLLRGCPDPLPLIFAKGGASVLTDGYLAAGNLSANQAKFAFVWGVLLQLGDDLQDVAEDCANGHETLFTARAKQGPLDELTNRTFHFARSTMSLMQPLQSRETSLQEVIERSSFSLLVRAAGKNRTRYSDAYITMLERYSPLSFSAASAAGFRSFQAGR